MISRTIHFAVDATLFAAVLAGIKLKTGYTPNVALLNQPDVERYVHKYLDYGDYVLGEASGMASKSAYFTRA